MLPAPARRHVGDTTRGWTPPALISELPEELPPGVQSSLAAPSRKSQGRDSSAGTPKPLYVDAEISSVNACMLGVVPAQRHTLADTSAGMPTALRDGAVGGVGTASGTSTATAVGVAIYCAVGTAAGTCEVVGVSAEETIPGVDRTDVYMAHGRADVYMAIDRSDITLAASRSDLYLDTSRSDVTT
jgi:hypothetical protein